MDAVQLRKPTYTIVEQIYIHQHTTAKVQGFGILAMAPVMAGMLVEEVHSKTWKKEISLSVLSIETRVERMEKYDVANGCPKCGNVTTFDRYAMGDTGEEHIRRKCTRCDYTWLTLPLDANMKAPRSPKSLAVNASTRKQK